MMIDKIGTTHRHCDRTDKTRRRGSLAAGTICLALLLTGCSLLGKGRSEVAAPLVQESCPTCAPRVEMETEPAEAAPPLGGPEIQDLRRIPQQLDGLAAAAGDRLDPGDRCRTQLQEEVHRRFFAPWTSSAPLFDIADSKHVMREEGGHDWYGVNKRKVGRKQMQELFDNCALAGFPSRKDAAIAVAPAHLRGLPSYLPLFEGAEDEPFDMLSYPQVKLNEPLKVLHASRDGVWFFVETGYSTGWIEARDVALVDAAFRESWMQGPHLVIVRDYTSVADGKGVGTYRAKIGTILPVVRADENGWDVSVASAGEGGKAESRISRIPREAAAPFPLPFNGEKIAMIGNQLLGQPYGWGEIYGLRDCSAMLRDFFLPFGIWLPRTSTDQIESIPRRHELAALAPEAKRELIREKGRPFLTLLHKPGHIMLYVGVDKEGHPLVFHDAWSIRVKGKGEERTKIIGMAAVTTLEPGKEFGLAPGSSLLERSTDLGVITDRCPQ